MDHIIQMRKTYLGAVPHTIYTALVWLTAALICNTLAVGQGIIFFIIAASFTFPAGELIRKLMKAPNLVNPDNKLPFLFMMLAFGIPLCYPLIYLLVKENTNYFFSAFSILVGAHYLPFAYSYGMKSFIVLGVLMVVQGTVCAFYFSDSLIMPALISSALLLFFCCLKLLPD